MSKMKMYTIWDKTAKRAGNIYLAVNDTIADRMFKQSLKEYKEKVPIAQIQDQELVCLGTYEMGEDDKMCGIEHGETYRVAHIEAGYIPEDYEVNVE